MAGKGSEGFLELTPEQQLDQELAYRFDLENAIGVIVAPPPNRVDECREIVWGQFDNTLSGDSRVFDDLRNYLQASADHVLSSAAYLPPPDRKAPTHRYEPPPAAQSWPEIAVLLWEHGKLILENLDIVLSVSLGVKELVSLTHKWFDKKNEEISKLNEPDYRAGRLGKHQHVQPAIVLTQGAIVALVVSDLVERFGFNDDLRIDTFPRGFGGYNDPAHPNSRLTYLIQCSVGGRVFVYVIQTSGEVTEHFELNEAGVVPLPTPNLLFDEENRYEGLPGENGMHLRVK